MKGKLIKITDLGVFQLPSGLTVYRTKASVQVGLQVREVLIDVPQSMVLDKARREWVTSEQVRAAIDRETAEQERQYEPRDFD